MKMGFNKRYIRKETILSGDMKFAKSLLNADALIMDKWSTKFYDNFQKDINLYQEIRSGILDRNKFNSSNAGYLSDPELKNVLFLSNAFLNLREDPSWLDTMIILSQIDVEIPEKSAGVFYDIVKLSIESTIEYFNS